MVLARHRVFKHTLVESESNNDDRQGHIDDLIKYHPVVSIRAESHMAITIEKLTITNTTQQL